MEEYLLPLLANGTDSERSVALLAVGEMAVVRL